MDSQYVEAVGWAGDALFLLSYYLVSSGKVEGTGRPYNLMNLGGAVCFGAYAIFKSAMPILILEVFWSGIAIFALWKTFKKYTQT